jgi:hypothetical protein
MAAPVNLRDRPRVHAVAVLTILFVLLVSGGAVASPIVVSFSDILSPQSGPLDGLALTGSFTYNDPYGLAGCTPSCAVGPLSTFPMLSFSLSVGNYSFNLSHTLPGARVLGPLGRNGWGPVAQINPIFLPTGVSSMELGAGATVFFWYTTPAGNLHFYNPTAITVTSASVPGPDTFVLSFTALLILALYVRGLRLKGLRANLIRRPS